MTKKLHELMPIRDYKINEATKMLHKSRFTLSTREQKIVLFLISKIEISDPELKELEFSLPDFYQLCGLGGDSSHNYQQIKKIVKDLHDKSFDITIKNIVRTKARWIKGVSLSQINGTIKITLDRNIEPYLLELRAKFTKQDLACMLEMKNQYSIKLYEILKNYTAEGEKEFSIAELNRQLFAENQVRCVNGKSKLLDMAMEEIMACSDLKVSYELKCDDRKNSSVLFSVKLKKDEVIPEQPKIIEAESTEPAATESAAIEPAQSEPAQSEPLPTDSAQA